MKFAIITDQHFCVRDSSEYFIQNYEKFYTNTFFPYLVDNDIKLIICLGDTFEDRRKLNVYGLNKACEMYFDKAKQLGIKIITILGNHDVYYKNTNEINSISILNSTYNNIEFVYDTKILDLDGFKLALCSWINKENYEDKLNFINTCGADYLAGHFEINGFEMTKGHLCEGGLDTKIFSKFDEVWSGHFHIKSQKGNIKYLGNPSQTNKGDIGYDRGFHIFDTDTRELKFILNPYIVYKSTKYNDLIDILKFDFNQFDNLFVTVYITSYANTDPIKLNSFIEQLNNVAYSVDIVETETILDEFKSDTDSIEYKGNLQLLNMYLETSVEDIDKFKKLYGYCVDLYNVAIEDIEDE